MPDLAPDAPTVLGALLRRVRETRGLTLDQVASAWADREVLHPLYTINLLVAIEENASEINLDVCGILDAINSIKPICVWEHDAISCAAGAVPHDLVSLILANPTRMNDVRKLFESPITSPTGPILSENL